MDPYKQIIPLVPDPYRVGERSPSRRTPVGDLSSIERRADRLTFKASSHTIDGRTVLDFSLFRPENRLAPKYNTGATSLTQRNAGTAHSVAVLEESEDGWRVNQFCIRLPPAPVGDKTKEEYDREYMTSIEIVDRVGPPTEVIVYFNHLWFPTRVSISPLSGKTPLTVGERPGSVPHIGGGGLMYTLWRSSILSRNYWIRIPTTSQ